MRRAVLSGATAVAVAAGLLALVPSAALTRTEAVQRTASAPSMVDQDPMDPLDVPQTCRSERDVAIRLDADVSRAASSRLVRFDGATVPVRTPQDWRRAADQAPRDPSWALWFHALVWLLLLAPEEPRLAVDLALDQARALADPGPQAQQQLLQRTGWTPGAIRNRLVVLRCLHRMTGDGRLIPIGRALGDALLDSRRYAGWPRTKPHNHGILANQVLIASARTFGRPEWARVSQERLRKDAPRVFSNCGMAFEQSTNYHALNVSLWSDFEEIAGPYLRRARFALAALTRPDGVLEIIGDGQARRGTPNGERLWCSAAGWAANTRAGMHYVLRFGPRAKGHGHLDHGAVTWFADGGPVLSDRGLFDKVRGARYDYAVGMSAHSVLEPVGVPGFNPSTAAERLSGDAYRLRDSDSQVSRERVLRIHPGHLQVTDRASAPSGSQQWIQHWQLAPGWRPTQYGAQDGTGRRLYISCLGGSLQAVRVEAFPQWREAVPAWDLQCRASGASIQLITTLTLR